MTLGLAVTRKFPWRAPCPGTLAAQAIGMAVAIALVWAAFGDAAKVPTIALGGALPGKGTTGLGVAACEFVGLTVGGLVLAAATVRGTSLNGMRSLMPMIFSGHWNDWLAYMIAPALGGMAGALTYEHLARPGRPPEPAGAVEEHYRGTLE